MAERRSARADPAAQVRQRQFRAAVELVGAAFGALGDARPSAGSGRGQGHRGATPGAPGQALTEHAAAVGFRRGRGNFTYTVPPSCLFATKRKNPARRCAITNRKRFPKESLIIDFWNICSSEKCFGAEILETHAAQNSRNIATTFQQCCSNDEMSALEILYSCSNVNTILYTLLQCC